VIGTHALLTDDTEFKNLGLAIIDEQHRFGVEQRHKLLLKSPSGLAPHLLTMTATPIPRSLQLTIFGDLDVSILNEMPKGRQPIQTHILAETEMRENLYPEIAKTIDAGRQAYWICKAIDDDPRTETTSVKSRAEKLKQLFPKYSIEFLHGRMKPAEKDDIMERFAQGKIQILVSTTVVEVGVDVPNSTLMIIENSENYGLAQLHQLRGRVGRGQYASSCYLVTSGDIGPTRRLKELEKSNDGFYLAEVDLKLRGPGEIYGALQHGVLNLRIASLTDTRLIHRAQSDVAIFLKNPENMLKYSELMSGITRYQQITTLN
jgi:ATP-dependent DNA helicase RecG